MPNHITVLDEHGNELKLTARNEIRTRCAGDGTHDAWEGGMTASEMDEQGDEFLEDYLAGHYSVPCTECGGRGVVAVPDESRANPTALAIWRSDQRDAAERRHELRMGY
jgi:RecJ-like exonuclease